ncbi:MAG: FliH/SctL family protein [Candidatus Methylomirabilales bacterium]
MPELGTAARPPAAAPEQAAHRLVREAERQAQALMEAAKHRAAAQVEAGHREGVRQGRAEAVAEARESLRRCLESLDAAAGRLRELEEQLLVRGESLVVELALAVAERLLRAELPRDPEAVVRAARAALAACPEPGELVLRVHPSQRALLEEAGLGHPDVLPAGATLRIADDPALLPGECRVQGPACLVEATLAAGLAEARRRLLEEP